MTGRWNDDPAAAVERSLVERGVMKPRKTRAQERRGEHGEGRGEGKHPEGATRPFVEERVPRRRAKAKAARKARRGKRR